MHCNTVIGANITRFKPEPLVSTTCGIVNGADLPNNVCCYIKWWDRCSMCIRRYSNAYRNRHWLCSTTSGIRTIKNHFDKISLAINFAGFFPSRTHIESADFNSDIICFRTTGKVKSWIQFIIANGVAFFPQQFRKYCFIHQYINQ